MAEADSCADAKWVYLRAIPKSEILGIESMGDALGEEIDF